MGSLALTLILTISFLTSCDLAAASTMPVLVLSSTNPQQEQALLTPHSPHTRADTCMSLGAPSLGFLKVHQAGVSPSYIFTSNLAQIVIFALSAPYQKMFAEISNY